jgi:NADH-quinone oxidoreductase subunit I
MPAKTKIIPRIERGIWEQIYLPELVRGLGVTMKHFVVNTFGPKDQKEICTLKYPEEKREFPTRFRGLHRLMKREDGSVRCTACMMCATVCPANCIHIEAAERENPQSREIEKYPAVFEIDELVCVVCGFCVEACPCDAIRMDSHVQMTPVNRRAEAVLIKDELMERGAKSLARDGGAGPDWREKYDFLGPVTKIYRPEDK